MAVSIIGAGAIGLLFAAQLQQNGIDVTLYTRTTTQANKLEAEGLYLLQHGHRYHVPVRAQTLTKKTNIPDSFIIVAVKQYQLDDVFPILKQNSHGKLFLFLQNGMGHLTYLEKIEECQIFLGIVEHGAKKISENEVIHTGIGQTKIAPFRNIEQDSVPPIVQTWKRPDFPFEIQMDGHEMLTKKLVVNAVINPLTAIFQVTNGTLLTNEYLHKLMQLLFNETIHVLQLDKNVLWNYVITVCQQTANNHSSMLRDIQVKRQTEIDAISGYIIKLAKKQNQNVPYTTFVFNSIKAHEQQYLQLDKKEGRENAN